MESAASMARRVGLQHAEELLQKLLPKGTEIFTITAHRNQSNTAASVILLVIHTDGVGHREIFNISLYVARVMENSYDDLHRGVRMYGGQLDLGNHAVDWLSRHIHGEGNLFKHRSL